MAKTFNNDDFRKKMDAFAQRYHYNAEQVVRATALALLTGVVMKSPVKSGRFRGNWFVQEDTSDIVTNDVDKSGSGTISRGQQQIAKFSVGGKMYILNHLPYGLPLEFGSSEQAPNGMVRITAAEFEQHLSNAVKGVKK